MRMLIEQSVFPMYDTLNRKNQSLYSNASPADSNNRETPVLDKFKTESIVLKYGVE